VKQASWILLLSLTVVCAQGEKGVTRGSYKPPVVVESLFGDEVMLAPERKNYATNLATYVANLVSSSDGSKEVLTSARRILALSLHLERRNKQAMVVNFQLAQGVMPQVKSGDYNARTFSRLLMTRAKLLLKEGKRKEDEMLLARYFIDVAAHIDPRNEDAVFECESQRLDFGELNWAMLTDTEPPSGEEEGAR